ncbi:MAG: ABC transporter substrate-binding protein [Chloroflexi bacterium]|nr:ABC transporter substrate-binding protein [Chloroflexota bacterium]
MEKEGNYWTQIFYRPYTRRQVLTGAARAGLGVAGLSLLGCAPGGAPGAKKRVEEVTISYATDIVNMDTHLDSGITGVGVHIALYDGLTDRDRELKLVAKLAESWKAAGEQVWEFKLRKGVKFTNGEPFNADVVKFNIERQQDVEFKPRYISDFKDIKVEIVDPYTVRMNTPAADAILPAKFAQALTVPMDYVKKNGNAILGKSPVGSGPFKFVEWAKDEKLVLEANPDYWGGAPAIKKVTWKPIPLAEARVGALKTGGVDWIYQVPEDRVKELEADRSLGVKWVGSAGTGELVVGYDYDTPLKDKRVRQALRYAIDGQSIVKNILGGVGTVVATVLAPSYFGYDETLKPYPYDPKKAKELLAAAGYASGLDIALDQPWVMYPKDNEIIDAIVGFLREVGVRVKLTRTANKSTALIRDDYKSKAGKGYPGLFYGARGHASLDADAIMYQSLHTKGTINYGNYSNPDLDKLLDKARATVDPESRKKIYKDAQKLVYDDLPWIFTIDFAAIHAFNKKKLSGIHPRMWLPYVHDVEPA